MLEEVCAGIVEEPPTSDNVILLKKDVALVGVAADTAAELVGVSPSKQLVQYQARYPAAVAYESISEEDRP